MKKKKDEEKKQGWHFFRKANQFLPFPSYIFREKCVVLDKSFEATQIWDQWKLYSIIQLSVCTTASFKKHQTDRTRCRFGLNFQIAARSQRIIK